jgi:hypothetical protein
MEQDIIYVRLDVHKDTVGVALAEAGTGHGESTERGDAASAPHLLYQLAEPLTRT